jgi:hypothetical protein
VEGHAPAASSIHPVMSAANLQSAAVAVVLEEGGVTLHPEGIVDLMPTKASICTFKCTSFVTV